VVGSVSISKELRVNSLDLNVTDPRFTWREFSLERMFEVLESRQDYPFSVNSTISQNSTSMGDDSLTRGAEPCVRRYRL